MNTSAIARPYAKAIFEIAHSDAAFSNWATLLKLLSEITSNKDAQGFLSHPQLSNEQRLSLFTDICGSQLETQAHNLLQLLAEEGRLLFLPEIEYQFNKLVAEQQKILDVKVISAFAMGAEERSQLVATLTKRFERDVAINYEVDSALIGGLIIYANDKVIDGSIRGRLEKLKEHV